MSFTGSQQEAWSWEGGERSPESGASIHVAPAGTLCHPRVNYWLGTPRLRNGERSFHSVPSCSVSKHRLALPVLLQALGSPFYGQQHPKEPDRPHSPRAGTSVLPSHRPARNKGALRAGWATEREASSPLRGEICNPSEFLLSDRREKPPVPPSLHFIKYSSGAAVGWERERAQSSGREHHGTPTWSPRTAAAAAAAGPAAPCFPRRTLSCR